MLEAFPADRVPTKPIPQIGEHQEHDVYMRSMRPDMQNPSTVWLPSDLDAKYFVEIINQKETA